MFPVCEANYFFVKNTGFSTHSGQKQQRLLCRILGWAALVAAGGSGHGITMLMVEAVRIGGGGRVEGFICGGKVERNGWQRDDNQ